MMNDPRDLDLEYRVLKQFLVANNYPATVLYTRIALANHAYMYAQSDWARQYWDSVTDQLVKNLSELGGTTSPK